ncbi:MAG: phospholipase D family protein [Porticoccaceae bacterium]|jgi:phosphatidylserine/phosphatidylglycerophosphate/cardiolipin synthase-like enzyme|nr:phospholipase D family protein [Porticoccaceae bacterium]HLS99732.1 phospholipase D family protein [Porticoccaceae bacterium]
MRDTPPSAPRKDTKPRRKLLLGLLLAVLGAVAIHHQIKPLPEGLALAGPERPLLAPLLLIDRTWVDGQGVSQNDHVIFDEVLRLIGQARQLVVVDMFLFNDSGGGEGFRPLARELTDALLARQQAVPGIRLLVISDPFNSLYGGTRSPYFEELRAAGIPVVETPLGPLRDSNPLWSAPWRLCCQWFGNDPDGGWLPSPVSGDRVTLRSYLALLNFKANHRKTLVVDTPAGLRGLVSSANPHDGSSRHSNIALAFDGPAALDLLRSELAVAALAGVHLPLPPLAITSLVTLDPPTRGGAEASTQGALPAHGGERVRILTEGAIGDAALALIDGAGPGSRVDLAMFYLSHRGVVEALIRARDRGARVRVLLDANKDAFGREKDGVPNRPVAAELHRAGIPVRFANTHGEQFHSKVLMRRDGDGAWRFLLGSANFTRRNLDNFNLETNVLVSGPRPTALIRALAGQFDQIWRLGPDTAITLSLPYHAYRDESPLTYWRYRLMEATGMSTF